LQNWDHWQTFFLFLPASQLYTKKALSKQAEQNIVIQEETVFREKFSKATYIDCVPNEIHENADLKTMTPDVCIS